MKDKELRKLMLLDDADAYMYKNKQLCKKYKGNRKYE